MKFAVVALALIGAGVAAQAETDVSAWMHMKGGDYNNSSFTRDNWLDPENPEAPAVSVANSAKRKFYADKRIDTPTGASTFGGETLAIGSGVIFYLNRYSVTHTIADLILLDGSTIRQTAYGQTHAGATRVEGTATYAFGLYSNGSTWTVASSFASDDNAILNFGYGTSARERSVAMQQTISISGGWSNYYGTLNLVKGAYYLLGSAATPLAGTLCVQSNAFVKAAQTSGTFQLGGLRLEEGGSLMFGLSGGATMQFAVSGRMEVVGHPIIDVAIPANQDHLDLVKLSGAAAEEANLPDVSGLKLAPEQIVGLLPEYEFVIVDGEAAGEKIVRLKWTPFKCMTKANDYSKEYDGTAFYAGSGDSYWMPAGVPDPNVACTVRVDAVLSAHMYGAVSFPNLTLCMRDKTFYNNANEAIFAAVYFDGDCTISGSAHGGAANKVLFGDIYINGKLSVGGWGGPVRGIAGALHGQGQFVAGHDASARGILLKCEGSDFAGQYFLYGPADSFASKPARHITLGDGFGFGGVYSGSAPMWQSTVVSNAYVVLTSDVTMSEPTRGLYLYGGTTFEVPTNTTLTISEPLTVDGNLVKCGPGTLTLGNSSLKFAVGGVQQDASAAGRNTLSLESGALNVTHKDAVNGLQVQFAAGTRWVVDLGNAAMKDSGVVNTLTDAPFSSAAADGKFTLEVVGGALGPGELSVPICTVSSSAPALQFVYPDQLDRRMVNLVAHVNSDGTVSYVLKVEAKRGLMFLIDGTASGADVPVEGLGVERMRFGALSDIHIAQSSDLAGFEKALRKFDDWQADAVLCCGDIADYGLFQQLKMAGDTWKKVFPDNLRSDGQPIVNLLHYGDHDMSTSYADNDISKSLCPDDDERHASILYNGDRGAFWKAAFGENEPWSPIVLRYVKGYPFVLSHFTRGETGNENGNNVPGLDAFFQEHAAAFSSGKPFFYSQHRIPKDTVLGPDIYGQDDGTVGGLLSQYPNAVAFCGHHHMSASIERSIWQGAFTCIQVPGHRYSVTESGYENGYGTADSDAERVRTMRSAPSNSARQFLFCRVYDRALVIERLEYSGSVLHHLGDDWVVPFESFALPPNARPFNFAVRSQTLPTPVFPPEAAITVSCVVDKDRNNVDSELFKVLFPAAPKSGDHPRGVGYRVTMQTRVGEIVETTCVRKVYPNLFYYGDGADAGNVAIMFRRAEVEDGREHRFIVEPMNGYELASDSIVSDWAVFSYQNP